MVAAFHLAGGDYPSRQVTHTTVENDCIHPEERTIVRPELHTAPTHNTLCHMAHKTPMSIKHTKSTTLTNRYVSHRACVFRIG